MYCPDCGNEINEFSDTCGKCGYKQKPKYSDELLCGKYTPEQVERSYNYWLHYEPPYDLETIAKGLIRMGSQSIHWRKAKPEERQRAKELYEQGYRPKKSILFG